MRFPFGRRREAELDEEIRAHLAMAAEDREARGATPDDAAHAAHREFGNVALVKEVTRETWGGATVERFLQDVGYALRLLRRSPGFTAAGLVTLALGIGATTAVFSVVYGVLLRPLPYANANRLVRIWEEHPPGVAAAGGRWLSNRAYFAWMERSRTLDALGAYGTHEHAVAFDDDLVRMYGAEVSPSLLPIAGARPALGRLFDASDAAEHAAPVVILGETLWRQRFGADPTVIGRSIAIDGAPATVIGVLEAGFSFPDPRARFWLPYVIAPVPDLAVSQRTTGLGAIGLMKPGITPEQVSAEGTAAARSVPVTLSTELLWGKGGPPIVHVRRLADDVSAPVRPALLVLAGAVALVLLIGCANVASLLMSRGLARQRELAIRAAIGASRCRLVRQLLTETSVLAALGGAGGLAIAWMLVRLAPVLAPASFPRMDDVRIDMTTLGAAVVASIFAAFASGLAPALRAGDTGADSVRLGAGANVQNPRTRRLRSGLVVAETAFAVPLLVGATLLAHSFLRLTHVDAGYGIDRVLTARVDLLGGDVPGRSERLIEAVLSGLRARGDVAAAGAGTMIPFTPFTAITSFTLPGPDGGAPVQTRARTYVVTPGYAEALGLRLVGGRLFAARDVDGGVRPIIVNEQFARQYLSGAPVIGRQFGALYKNETGSTSEIVGVVGNVLKDGNDRKPEPEVYFLDGSGTGAAKRRMLGYMSFAVRTTGDPAALAAFLRSLIRNTDKGASIEAVEPLAQAVAASVAEPRFATTVLAAFSLLALTLTAIGLYGVLSFGVTERRRELGVRAALGARRGDLVGLVLREGLGLTVLGVALGLGAAAGLTRLLQGLLFGVAPLDAVAFAAAPLVLLPIAVAACALPARRAAAADPAEALRCE